LAQNHVAKEETIVSGMAGRYAQALFDLARERGVTDQVAADLSTFSALVAESPDLQRFIKSPVFTAEEQVRALTAKRRLFAISDMIRDFNKLNDFAKGLARAEVTVADPLKDPHVEALKTALAELTGGQSVEITVKVDPSIIGGLIVKLGSRMVDGSLKTKLNSIRTRMKEVG
jgi:F-type H+-transporting ATPase subunit delta